MDRIRRIVTHGWPLAAAAFFIPFGSDWVTVYVLAAGLKGVIFFALPCIAATTDILFWNWFMRWGLQRVASARKVHEAIEEFREDGMSEEARVAAEGAGHIWLWIVGFVERSISMDAGWRARSLTKTLDLIRRCPPLLGYVMIASLPIIPGIGMYIGIIVCQTVKLPNAFYILLAGNLTKVFMFTLFVYLTLHG